VSRALTAAAEQIAEVLEAQRRVHAVAVVLTLDGCPEGLERLDEGRCVRVVGGDLAERRRILMALRRGRTPEGIVTVEYRPGASRFIAEVLTGSTFEVACWGARGDRKTSAALGAVIVLADLHREAGGALPFRVMVPTDSQVNHELKLCRSLVAPHWGGVFSLRDDKHTAVLTINGEELAHLDLFGVGDPGAWDRLRMECHAAWYEEIAPAALEATAGVPEDAWSLGLTSIRLPTRRPVSMATSNYPDEDFWAWQRWEVKRHPGTISIRIPAGESASPEARARWAVALAGRPDLEARLLAGEPGSVVQGPQVAVGYNAAIHVAREPLIVRRLVDVWFGHDSAVNAHTHATVIGQRIDRGAEVDVYVYACLVSERTGLKQHMNALVLPWLARRAPWALAGATDRLSTAMTRRWSLTMASTSTRTR